MSVESATFISGLDATRPLGTDPKSQGDDHLRLIKVTLLNTFPNVTGAVNATHTQLNQLADGGTIADARLSSNVALLNGNNTFSGINAFASAIGTKFYVERTDAGTDAKRWRHEMLSNGTYNIVAVEDASNTGNTAISLTRTTTTVTGIALTATAITLNGVNVTDYARLSQNNTFTSSTSTENSAIKLQANEVALTLKATGAGTNEKTAQIRMLTSGLVINSRTDADGFASNLLVAVRSGSSWNSLTLAATSIALTGAVTGTSFSGAGSGLTSLNASNISSGELNAARLPSTITGDKTFSGTVTAGHVARSTGATAAPGQVHARTSATTIATQAAGDWTAVYNNSSSSITLTQGSGLTLRLGGTATTGSRTLAPRGLAVIWYNSATEAVVNGSGVS
jgi:hypothetical protein